MSRSVRGSRKAWFNLKRKPSPASMKGFTARNARLLKLGYSSYADYLSSDLWKTIRGKKLQKYPSCLLCGKPAGEVHHLSYDQETMLGTKDFCLVQLCGDCHHLIEFDGIRKRDLDEANDELMRLASRCALGRSWMRWRQHATQDYIKTQKHNRAKARKERKAKRYVK